MKYKVLHVITRLDRGGSATNTIETVARLDKNKYTIDLVSGLTNDPNGSIEKTLQSKKVSYIFVNDLCRQISPIKDIKAFFVLCKIIKANKYDIVHTHSSKAGILGRWAAKCAGVKIIIHTPHGNVFYGYFNAFVSAFFIAIERVTALITDRIITLTKIGIEEHVAFRIAKRDKFISIYSGIDLEACKIKETDVKSFRRDLGLNERDIVFGNMSRLTPIKGNMDLVDSFASVLKEISTAKLLFVGDGEEKDAIEKKIAELGIKDAVKLLGWKEDVFAILGIMDIFVLASLNEGMGRAVLEAMAAGKPVIATKVGGVPELVVDGKTGILVDPQSSHQLAAAMISLGGDQEKIQSFGWEGKKRATEKFSIEKMVKDIDQLYDKVRGEMR